MAEHFTHFTRKKEVNYWLKTQQEQQEDNSTAASAIWRTFAELNKPLSPKLTPSKMNLTTMEESMFYSACFKITNYFE